MYVGRPRLRATPPSLRAVPKAEGGMNVDNVELVSRFLNVSRNSLRKFHGPKTVRPPLFWEQAFEEHWLHALPQIPQLPCQVVHNSRHSSVSFARRSPHHQNP